MQFDPRASGAEIADWLSCAFPVLQKISTAGTSNADVSTADPGMYQLDITLRRGQSLAARDRGGKHKIPFISFIWICDELSFP